MRRSFRALANRRLSEQSIHSVSRYLQYNRERITYATMDGEVTFTRNTAHSPVQEAGNQEAEAGSC